MDKSHFKNMILEYTRRIEENTNIALSYISSRFELTNMQLRILLTLCFHETQTIGGLAEKVRIAGTNLSSMCKKLEQRGLLVRQRDQKDERVVHLQLTEEGKEIALEINAYITNRFTEVMGNQKVETLETIIFGVKALNDLMEKVAQQKD